jgi:hypothetical protein
MRKLDVSNLTLWACIGVALALFIPAAIILPRQELFEIMDAVCVAVGAGVTVGYSKAAWGAMKLPPHKMTAAHLVVTSIFLMSMATVIVFAGQWLWRINGKPDAIIDSLPIAFSRWIIGTGLILSLLTSYSKEGLIEVGAYKRTAVLVTISVFVGALLIWFGLG